jgi:small-conductance mechanosensitive channel
MEYLNIFGLHIPLWAAALALFTAWVFLGWTLKKAAFIWLNAISKKSDTPLDDILIDALDWPVTILVVVSAVLYIPHVFFADKLPFAATRFFTLGLKALVIFSAILFVNKLLLGLVRAYSPRIEVLRISGGFTEVLVRVIVFTMGGLILLDSFGISITPILASLGVGSLAVALALQPTLENLISGFQIIMDRPILPGHFVKLESGEEGYVDHIGWRSTWVRLLSDNMVIVPNKQIVNSRVLNYYYPTKELAVLVEASVG